MRESTAKGQSIDLGEFERRLRGAEPPRNSTVDPLSELARLINGEERGKAAGYDKILGPAPETRAARRQSSAHEEFDAPLRGAYGDEPEPHAPPAPAYHAPAQDHYRDRAASPAVQAQSRDYRHDPYADPGAVQRTEPEYYDDYAGYDDAHRAPGAGGHPSDDPHGQAWAAEHQTYLDYGDEDYEDDRKARGGFRSWFKPWHAVTAVLAIGAASIGWGFAHRGGAIGSREIATINAPEGPSKVQPAESDQTASGQSATVLDRNENAPVKAVVSHQEQAVDPKVAPRIAQLGAAGTGPDAEPAPLHLTEPKKVKTVSVRPDGTVIENDAMPSAVAKATGAPPSKATETHGGTPKNAAKPATTPRVEKTAKSKPKAEADAGDEAAANDAPAAPQANAKGGFAVQFGAAGSEAEARTLLGQIAHKYGTQLGGRRPTFKPAKVGDKTVYRVRIAGVSKDSANAICDKVKASGGNCFVAGQ
jgi:hypothetical protein